MYTLFANVYHGKFNNHTGDTGQFRRVNKRVEYIPRISPPGTFAPVLAAAVRGKNLDILQDQMFHEALAYKKAKLYSNYFEDPALRRAASQIANHHRKHYDDLLNYLKSHR